MRAARFGGYGIVKGELKKLFMLSTREMTLSNNDMEQTRTFLRFDVKHQIRFGGYGIARGEPENPRHVKLINVRNDFTQ